MQEAGTEVGKAKNGQGSAPPPMAYAGAKFGKAVLAGLAGEKTTECAYVQLRRKVLVSVRNPGAVGLQIGVPVMLGSVLGGIFKGIGAGTFGLPQISFVFTILTMCSLQSSPLRPLRIEERGFMKHEPLEKL